MDFITPLIKPGIDLVKGGLGAARKKLGKHKYDQLVSAVITELLKEDPDFSAAEAQLAAARATGVEPDMHLLRAQSMLFTAQKYARRRISAAARAKWAKKLPSKKKSKPQRRSARSRAKSKRKT